MREKYCPTEEEMKRYEVFMEVKMGKISLKYATKILGVVTILKCHIVAAGLAPALTCRGDSRIAHKFFGQIVICPYISFEFLGTAFCAPTSNASRLKPPATLSSQIYIRYISLDFL